MIDIISYRIRIGRFQPKCNYKTYLEHKKKRIYIRVKQSGRKKEAGHLFSTKKPFILFKTVIGVLSFCSIITGALVWQELSHAVHQQNCNKAITDTIIAFGK